jgi:hypothetical protein
MIRIGLRYIALALAAGSLLVIATTVLVRLVPQPDVMTLQAPLHALALPLDENGTGTQVLDNAILSVRLDPYPPRASRGVTVSLIALDRAGGATMVVTPTLSVAELTQVDGVEWPMARVATGAYAASAEMFPHTGQWRLRARVDFGAGEPYSLLVVTTVD